MILVSAAKARRAVNRIVRDMAVEFNPVTGQTSYLYEREDTSFFISLVEPRYWNAKTPPLTFVSEVEFTQSGGWKFKKKS